MRDETPRISLLDFAVLIALGVLLVIVVQLSTRQAGIERRVTNTEQKIDRVESWMMNNGQVSSQRHTELMKLLTSLNANSEYMVSYYKRAQSEAERK